MVIPVRTSKLRFRLDEREQQSLEMAISSADIKKHKIAKAIGITPSQFSRVLNGKVSIANEDLRRIYDEIVVYCPSTSSNLVWVKEYFSSMGLSVSDNILREQLSRLRASVGDSLLVPYFDYGRRLFLEITPEKRVQLLGELEQVFDRYTPQG